MCVVQKDERHHTLTKPTFIKRIERHKNCHLFIFHFSAANDCFGGSDQIVLITEKLGPIDISLVGVILTGVWVYAFYQRGWAQEPPVRW